MWGNPTVAAPRAAVAVEDGAGPVSAKREVDDNVVPSEMGVEIAVGGREERERRALNRTPRQARASP